MLTIDGLTSFLQIMDLRVLTRILKIGVKRMSTRKFRVLANFSIGTFEKVGSQNAAFHQALHSLLR